MKRRFLFLLIAAFPIAAFSQNESFKGDPFIEVTGTAHQEIEPNEIFFMVRLKEFEENKEKTQLEKLDRDFLSAMKEAGIDRNRLEIADAGSIFEKYGRRDREKDAFRTKTYQMKLTSAAELEKVIQKLQPVKVDYADVFKVNHSEIEKLKIDLKTKALQAAKNKADYLLKSIDHEAGSPLMIRDFEMGPIQPYMEYPNMMMKSAAGEFAQEEAQIGFRKIRIEAQITAQFQILSKVK